MSVSRETRRSAYLALLQRWNVALNLTSNRDGQPAQLIGHYENSLLLVPHLARELPRLVDLGSGQGFPAIPLAIETGLEIDLIESDRRKAAFLTTAMASLGLKGAVWPSRIEATKLPPALCVTARALAPIKRLATLASPFMADEGCCLFLKGPAAAQEVTAAELPFRTDIFATPDPASCIVKLTRLR